MKSFVTSWLLVAIVSLSSTNVLANLIEYNLAGAAGNQATTAPSLVASNLTGLNLTRSPGLTPSAGSNSMSSSNWSVGQFYSFGFTVAPTYQANLGLLEIGTSASNTGPRSFGVYTSVDNFTTPIATINHGDGAVNFGFVNSSINLSSLSALTGTVEFRLRVDSNVRVNSSSTISSAGTARITNFFAPPGPGLPNADTGSFRVTGTVSVVPEPSTLSLLVVALAVVPRLRRR